MIKVSELHRNFPEESEDIIYIRQPFFYSEDRSNWYIPAWDVCHHSMDDVFSGYKTRLLWDSIKNHEHKLKTGIAPECTYDDGCYSILLYKTEKPMPYNIQWGISNSYYYNKHVGDFVGYIEIEHIDENRYFNELPGEVFDMVVDTIKDS